MTCAEREVRNACLAEACEYTITCREERGEGPGGELEEQAMMMQLQVPRNPDAAPAPTPSLAAPDGTAAPATAHTARSVMEWLRSHAAAHPDASHPDASLAAALIAAADRRNGGKKTLKLIADALKLKGRTKPFQGAGLEAAVALLMEAHVESTVAQYVQFLEGALPPA